MFTMFSYIPSCKIRPREFIDRNIFYASYEKWEIKKENTKRLWSRNSNHSQSVYFCYLLLSKFPRPKTMKNDHFQNK